MLVAVFKTVVGLLWSKVGSIPSLSAFFIGYGVAIGLSMAM